MGNQGKFDYMVKEELKNFKKIYPHIKYSVMLAYMPSKRDEFDSTDYSDTFFPDELTNVPPRYAVDRRNRIMLEKADVVVLYVSTVVGGAAKWGEAAKKKNKEIINIYDFI